MAVRQVLLFLVIFAIATTTVNSAHNNNNSNNNNTYWEQLFLASPNTTLIREYLFNYTSVPHIAGSESDYETALYTKAKFEEFGISATIETHSVLLSYPLKRLVEIVYPPEQNFTATLKEPAIEPLSLDPTSNDTRSVDTFSGYAPSGNVTAELVYANYGRLEDFNALQAHGVNVTGKIVIVRYGQIFRGVKVKIAQERGAIGVLIYSDPADDGVAVGTPYPNGPWRPEEGVQRGSVQYLSKCAGDPADTAECLPPGAGTDYRGTLIPNIPVQPLSWGDAAPLLNGITNNPVPDSSWSGKVPNITYFMGPGPVKVHLETEILFNTTDIWNVVATIPGVDTDSMLVIGNHRDAWVFGAVDPSSGSAALLEIARSFGILLASGWKPQRNIVLCSWDAEEYGLVGSTAYTRTHKSDLVKKAVAYLNVDVAVGGWEFNVAATPSLRHVIDQAAAAVAYPGDRSISLLQQKGNRPTSVLGSGSDYTAFIDNLGIASMDVNYSNRSAGVYHSIYDSFSWMEKWGDPGFYYHQSIAQFLGLLALKIADAKVLPHNYTEYALQLLSYVDLVAGVVNGTQDVHLDKITAAVNKLYGVGNSVESEKVSANLGDSKTLNALNSRLVQTERQFINPQGLPGRPFYKHVVQASALYSGYGADVFPGLIQAVRDGNWAQAKEQALIIVDHIHLAANTLEGKQSKKKANKKKLAVTVSVVVVVVVVAAIVGILYWRKQRAQRYEKV